MTVQRCEVPIPPSANEMLMPLKTKTGRVFMAKTTKYKHWIEAAGMLMRVGMERVVTMPVSVRVEIRGGDGFPLRRDLDNCLKPMIDSLRAALILPNDRVTEVRSLSAEYFPAVDKTLPATCTVVVEQLTEGLFG